MDASFGRREYTMKAWKKILFLLLGILLTLGGWLVSSTGGLGRDRTASLISAGFFLAGGIYMLARAYRSRLILDGSRIDVRGAFTERSADLGEIEGLRTIQTRNGSYKRLQLRNGARAITLFNDFDTDDDFRRWIAQVPDLDLADREALLDEIKQDQQLGATPDERLAALATAKTIAVFLTIVTAVLAVAVNVTDDPLRLLTAVLLAIAPAAVLLLVWRSPMLYAVFKRKKDPRAELVFVLFIASFGFLIVNRGVHLVSVKPLAPEMIALGLLCFAPVLVQKGDSASAISRGIALFFFAGLYGYAVSVAADTQYDHGQISPYRATVLGKYESHGRSTSYTLKLGPWGPFEGENRLGVSARAYGHTDIGDTVCLDLHPGSLHAAWFEQVNCASQPAYESLP